MKLWCVLLLGFAAVVSADSWIDDFFENWFGADGWFDDSFDSDHDRYRVSYRSRDRDRDHDEYDPEDEHHYDEEISEEEAENFRYPTYYDYWDDEPERKCAEYTHHAKPEDKCMRKRRRMNWFGIWFSYFYSTGASDCKAAECHYSVDKGMTSCMQEVELHKPYTRSGHECKKAHQQCSKSAMNGPRGMDADEDAEDKGPPYIEMDEEEEDNGPPYMGGGEEEEEEAANDVPRYTLMEEVEVPGTPQPQMGNMYTTITPMEELNTTSVPASGCGCQTIWCVKRIYTVYKMNEKLYEGRVTVKYPCDCSCRKNGKHEESVMEEDLDE